MQFDEPTAIRLQDLYRKLRAHFGYADPWWPGNPFEIAVTAVLVQQCDWSIAWAAVQNMGRLGITTLSQLAEIPQATLQDSITKVAFAPTKSARLIAMAETILDAGFDSFERFLHPMRETSMVRKAVLALPGIGPETADCLLAFASEHPQFVVDAYTRRIFHRLNITPKLSPKFWEADRYHEQQAFFHVHVLQNLSMYAEFDFPESLPRDVALMRDYHALLVELGKHHCFKKNPHCHKQGKRGWPDYPFCEDHCQPKTCGGCPVAGLCQFPMN